MNWRGLSLAAFLGCSSFGALSVMQTQAAIAQDFKYPKKFRTQAELNSLIQRVKKGWTKQQVLNLLGGSQYEGTPDRWNYYVNQENSIKVIVFKDGRVFSVGDGMAG